MAGAAARTTRDRHASTTTNAVGMRTRDRRSRARLFGAPRAASCRVGALTTTKSALKILQKAQNATEMRASNFANIFAATGSLGPRRPMRCQHLIIRPGAFRIPVRCLGGAPGTRHGVNSEILTQNTCFGTSKRPPVRAFGLSGTNESIRTDEMTQGTRLSRLVQPNSRRRRRYKQSLVGRLLTPTPFLEL
jgi:hypothetical protein